MERTHGRMYECLLTFAAMNTSQMYYDVHLPKTPGQSGCFLTIPCSAYSPSPPNTLLTAAEPAAKMEMMVLLRNITFTS